MAVHIDRVESQIGDELGLAPDDLARLYNVDTSQLDRHLLSLGNNSQAIYEQIMSDIDKMRAGYQLLEVEDEHLEAVRAVLNHYIFHPLVATPMTTGFIGWRLGTDDAQYVAFRAADIVGMDFDWGDMLRLRLHRLIIWPDEKRPAFDQAFQDRLLQVIAYLVELTGVV